MSNVDPVKIEILLRQNIAKELEESRKALTDVDSGVKKTSGSFKEVETGLKRSSAAIKQAIAGQRQLIREITGDIKALAAAAKNESPGAGLTEILGDLRGARQALAEEQATLIGLQREQLEVNGEEEKSNKGVVDSLKNWAIGLASVGTVLSVFNSVVSSTRATSDQFEVEIAGMKSGLGFFWKTLASGDWTDFFKNMDRAIRTGKRYAEMMDEFKESNWALTMKEADSLEKISELEDKVKNKGLSIAERKAAGDERIKIEEDLSAERTASAKIEHDADVLVAMDRTKLSEETIKNILGNIDKEGKAKADQYNKDLAQYKRLRKDASAQAGSQNIAGSVYSGQQAEALLPGLQSAPKKVTDDAADLRKMGGMSDEMVDKLIGSYAKVKTAKDSAMSEIERVRALVHSLSANEEKEAQKKIDLIEQTKMAMETATGAELTALAKKFTLLEAEKKLKESIIEMEFMVAKNKPIEVKGAETALQAIRDAAKASGIDLENPKGIRDNDLEINKLKKGNEARIKQAEKIGKLGKDQKKDTQELANNFYEVADAADYLAQAIGDSNSGLADMLSGVGKIAGQLGNLAKAEAFSKDGMSKGDAISAAVSGATQLLGIVVGAAAERKRVMDEYYASIIAQQQQYNLLLNEQLLINSDVNGSIFLKDYEGSLKDSTAAYNDAQAKYQEELKKFSTAEAITGKKNVISGGNVLAGVGAGAALGAGIGSIVPVIGTLIGAAGGAIVGLFTGLFAKKKKDIVAPLLETYPDLIKANGEFNDALAKTLIANNKVTEATKVTLQNLIDWKDAAAKATAQLKSVITDLTGSLGDDLRNALVTAFEDGTDASVAFGDSVNKVLENILSNMIFNKVFAGAFAQLEKGMTDSYATGGDGNWQDDLKVFFDQRGALTDQFNKALTDAKQAGAADGFDIFSKDTTSSTATGMKGDIQRMTEETGSALTGNISAIRINMARMIESGITGMSMMQLSLDYQLRTADNTDVMSKTLGSIDTRLSRLELDGIKVK